ncbi:diguanylate cyclase domain-containing protein [Zavarzinia sp.]|uniref:sensor domain-containing diguanylate cyclase n=1 Tax=Zavarzinia sp. TaxID=2027920 RepID=UPI003566A699
MDEKPASPRNAAAAMLDRLVAQYPGPALIIGQGIRVVEENGDARPLVLALRAGHSRLIDLVETARHGAQGVEREILIDRSGLYQVTALPMGAAVVLLARDVTEERRRALRLAEEVDRLGDILSCLPDFTFETDRDGRLLFAAPATVFGYDAAALIGAYAADLIDPDWLSGRANPFVAREGLADLEVWLLSLEGSRRYVRLSARPVLDENGAVAGLRGVACDVTAARARETALTQALDRERLGSAVVNAMRGAGGPERAIRVAAEAAMATLHAQGALILARDGGSAMVPVVILGQAGPFAGRVASAVTQMSSLGPVVGRVERLEIDGISVLAAIAAEGGVAVGAIVLLRDGPDWPGEQAGILCAVADQLGLALGIRERVALLEKQSRVDALTGIMNRRAFDQELPAKLRQADRHGVGGALLLMDLDGFKPLNDRHGHAWGDKALTLLGSLFRDHLRAGDLVARLGGDEFGLWLDSTDQTGAFAKAGVLYELLEDLDRSLALPETSLGLSIGIALYRPGGGEDMAALMARADSALYRAKARGRNRAELAAPSGGEGTC